MSDPEQSRPEPPASTPPAPGAAADGAAPTDPKQRIPDPSDPSYRGEIVRRQSPVSGRIELPSARAGGAVPNPRTAIAAGPDDGVQLRLAIMTDMHVGSTGSNRWHNRFLSDRPEETAASTVAAINAQSPDLVLVLGDLSDTATSPQLHRARGVLESLKAPWVACRGNHDRPPEPPPAPLTNGSDAPEPQHDVVTDASPPDNGNVADTWDRWLGMHAVIGIVPADTAPLPDGVVLVVFDADWWTADDGIFRVAIDDDQISAVEAALDAAPRKPDLLIVACHFPFVRQTEHLRQMAPDAKNAGTLQDGQVIIDRIAPLAHRSLWLCGHQHFHQIVCSSDASDLPQWLHCTTASLVEFPAEYRMVTISRTSVRIHTETAVPDLLDAKPPRTSWVRGREHDREFVWETGERT